MSSGSKLPEPALAERFGTSRAPIREALYLLDQAGSVERTTPGNSGEGVPAPREIEELYQVRIALERIALERICEAPEMVASCLAVLNPIVHEMEVAQDDPMRYRELNYLFHRSIIVVSRQRPGPKAVRSDRRPLEDLPPGACSSPRAQCRSLRRTPANSRRYRAGGRGEGPDKKLEKHDLDGMRRAIASSTPGQQPQSDIA